MMKDDETKRQKPAAVQGLVEEKNKSRREQKYGSHNQNQLYLPRTWDYTRNLTPDLSLSCAPCKIQNQYLQKKKQYINICTFSDTIECQREKKR